MTYSPFLLGLALGYGVAVPLGPMNVEIMRRHLHEGARAGLALGLGACLADMTYLILLLVGVLAVLAYPPVLKTLSVIGAVILVWFAYKAYTMSPPTQVTTTHGTANKAKPWYRHMLEGILLTFFSPYAVLFWGSVSTQIIHLHQVGAQAPWLVAVGVLLSTISWVIFLNVLLHKTRERLPRSLAKLLNWVGGTTLLCFAGFSLM